MWGNRKTRTIAIDLLAGHLGISPHEIMSTVILFSDEKQTMPAFYQSLV